MISIKPIFTVKEHHVFIYPGLCREQGEPLPVIKLSSSSEPIQELIQYTDGSYCLIYDKSISQVELTLNNFGNIFKKPIFLT